MTGGEGAANKQEPPKTDAQKTDAPKTVILEEKKISYLQHGSPRGGGELLYLHGNTGSNIWFEKVMDQKEYRVTAPDMPNFGLSDPLDEADIYLYSRYMEALAEELQLNQPVLVGHSLGGAVAMAMALRRPEAYRALVLIDSCPPEGLVTPEEHYPAIELFKTNREMMKNALAAVAPTLEDPQFLDRLTDRAMMMAPHAFIGNARALERFSCVGQCGGYTKPVLVVYGKNDRIISEGMATKSAAAFPQGQLLTLEEVGHSVMVEKPELFTSLLQTFLSKL